MTGLLSNLVNNLAERILKIKSKYGHDNKKCETFGNKYIDYGCCLEHTSVKDDLIEYKFLYFNKNYQETFYENLKKRFVITCKFSNHHINLFYCYGKVSTDMSI